MKICQDRNAHLLIANVRVWHGTYMGSARSLGFGSCGKQGTGLRPDCLATGLRITPPHMIIAEQLPYEYRVVCSRSAEVVSHLVSGVRQTLIHIVVSCPRTKFADQGLLLLHEADDNAVTWLEDVATKAFANTRRLTFLCILPKSSFVWMSECAFRYHWTFYCWMSNEKQLCALLENYRKIVSYCHE